MSTTLRPSAPISPSKEESTVVLETATGWKTTMVGSSRRIALTTGVLFIIATIAALVAAALACWLYSAIVP